jgi:hypothetical protein
VYQTGIVASRMGKADVARRASEVLADEFVDRRGAFTVSAATPLGRVARPLRPPYRRLRAMVRSRAASKDPAAERLRGEIEELLKLPSSPAKDSKE